MNINYIFSKYKKTSFGNTLGHAKNYFLAAIATKAVGFISIPILTRLLTTEEYGILNIFNAYSGFIVVIFTLNLHISISRYYYEEKNDFNSFVGVSLVLVAVSCIVCFSLFILFRDYFASLMHLPVKLMILFLPITINNVFRSIYDQIKGSRLETKELSLLSTTIVYVSFGLTIFFIYRLSSDKYLAAIYSNIIIGSMTSLFVCWRIKDYIRFSFSKQHIKYILSYSIPYIAYSLSGIILTSIDRIMINSSFGPSQAGLYAFAANIGMLFNFFTSSLNSAWIPRYFDYMNKGLYLEHDKDMEKLIRISLFFAFCLIVFGREIGVLFSGSSFHSSLHIIPLIVIGYVFEFMATIYQRNIGFGKKTIFLALSVLAAGIINIILNALFLKKFGYDFGAVTTVVSYSVLLLITWFISKNILKTHTFRLLIVFKYLLVFCFFNFLLLLIQYFFKNIFFLFVFKCSVALFFLFFLLRKDSFID